MALVPYYDPFQITRRELGSLPPFPRLFDDDWFESPFNNLPRVRADVHETPTEVIVSAEIPGLESKEDVNIIVHDNYLHLSGKVERTDEQKNGNVHRTERLYGQFVRNIPLPTNVDESSAKASYRNGVLEVRIEKATKQIGQQVDVDFH